MNSKKTILAFVISCCFISNNSMGKTYSQSSSCKGKTIEMQHENHHISTERDDYYERISAYYDPQQKVIYVNSNHDNMGEIYVVDKRNHIVAHYYSCHGEISTSQLKHGDYKLFVILSNDTYYGIVSI